MNESTRKRLERANAGVRKAAPPQVVRPGPLHHTGQEEPFGCAVNAQGGKVLLDFRRAVVCLALSPAEARQLGELLCGQAFIAEASLS